MKEYGVQFTVILGPGNHQQKLIDALITHGKTFEVFNYYPIISHTIYNSHGHAVYNHQNIFLSKWIQILWAIIIRIKPLKNINYHFYLNFKLYDYWISTRTAKSSKLLWAWSQVSLKTMLKFKSNKLPIILEKPMIHVNEWQQILDKEYQTFSPGHYRYYEICKTLRSRMKQEYELADTIVVLSDFALQSFASNKIDKNKLSKVSLYAYSEGLNHDTKSTEKPNYEILFVGRIDVLKGIPRLLKVIDKLAINNKNVNLTLVGDIKQEVADYFKVKRRYVKIVGTKSKTELVDIYKNSDLLILPSVQESFGLVLLEALSNGLKVLASKNTGAPDIAKYCDQVTLFNPFDENELEEKILSLINNKSMKAYCDLSMFSKENYDDQIGEVLNKYLNIK